MTQPLTRKEAEELRNALAWECLSAVEDGVPECDDERLGYVSIQVDRDLWLAARHCPKPPYLEQMRAELGPREVTPEERLCLQIPCPNCHALVTEWCNLIDEYGCAARPTFTLCQERKAAVDAKVKSD